MVNNSPILKTLIYGDVFDYPMTKEEIWRFLISEKSIGRGEFEKELKNSLGVKLIHFPGGHFYCLSGRKEIVEKRIEKKKESQKKLVLARKIIQKISLIPTVLFIGISGGLALENASEKDDIDLFVITSKDTLWTTRLLLVLLLKLMGYYRGRGKKESQKVCLNMLIDEEALMFEKDRQNLYTAHEIVQLKPMFDRNNTYNKFLNENKWVAEFLPNGRGTLLNKTRNHADYFFSVILRSALRISALEFFAKDIQLNYMRRHRTIETINDNMLAFHPFEYKDYVLKEYNKRLKLYDI